MDTRSATSCFTLLLLFMLLLALFTDAKIYIVYMGEKQHDDPAMVTASHHRTLASVLGSEAHDSQAEELENLPEVVSVMPNTYHELHTTRSWDFLGLNYYQPSGLLKKAKYGKDVIVGIVDSGIWPESRSFDDSGYGPVPKRWKGVCQTGEAFNATSCNRKIIGVRWFSGDAEPEQLKGEYMSARDAHGHGTHTASTVAGVPVRNVSYGGLGRGVARGGAPRARVAVYKVCWGARGECGDASILAAMDHAIKDGVDVLSLSLTNLVVRPGTLHAVARGITVVFSAGNHGPVPYTVQALEPWVISVAASSIDRSFPTVISLGNEEKLVGQSFHHGAAALNRSDFRTIVYGYGCDEKALESVNVTGNILLCFAPWEASKSWPSNAFILPLVVADKARAKGIIFAQYTTNLLESTTYCKGHLHCVVVDYEIGYRIMNYALTHRAPVAKISPAVSVVGNGVLSPRVAAFSGRGPSMAYPAILKPDIAAPGVSILAAMGDSYEFLSGTSMACPHVSAIVALLKSVHPDWSPAMIKSAIVTTASVTDNFGMPIQAESVQRKLAGPFDFGGGHINPDKAADPGLIYDIHPEEYIKFFDCTLGPRDLCETYMGNLYHLNLPSIVVPDLKDCVTVWRTVTNVGPVEATYRAMIEAPAGVKMSVEPSVLTFKKGGPKSATFKVTFNAKQKVQGGYTFGSLTWLDGRTHSVRIPIAIRTIIQDLVSDTA